MAQRGDLTLERNANWLDLRREGVGTIMLTMEEARWLQQQALPAELPRLLTGAEQLDARLNPPDTKESS